MLVEKTLSTKRTHSMYRSGQRRRQEPVVREKKMSRRRELSPRAFLCLDLFFNVVFFKKKVLVNAHVKSPGGDLVHFSFYFILFYFILFSFSFYFIGAGERRRQEPGGD